MKAKNARPLNCIIKQFLILAPIIIWAVGCATSYQSDGFTGGFRDMRLAPDVFRITFRGNGYTSTERAQDFALLRACELTLNNGFNCFTMLKSQSTSTPFVISTPATSTTTTTGGGVTTGQFYGNQYQGYTYLNATSQTTYYPGQNFVLFKPTSGLLIQAFPKKPANIATFDAVFLRNEITNRYHIHLNSLPVNSSK